MSEREMKRERERNRPLPRRAMQVCRVKLSKVLRHTHTHIHTHTHTRQVGRVELSKVRALEAEDIKLLSESLKSNQTLKELTICAALSGADAGTYPSHI